MDNAHSKLIHDLQIERSRVIDLLCRAREIMAGAAAIMELNKRLIADNHPIHWTDADQAKVDEIKAFLDAGLFGDREVEQ